MVKITCNHVPQNKECPACKKGQRSADIERLAREVMTDQFDGDWDSRDCKFYCRKCQKPIATPVDTEPAQCQNPDCEHKQLRDKLEV